MPRTEDWTPGVDAQHNQEEATGVITQSAPGTRSTLAYAADDEKIFGAPIKVVVKGLVAADAAYDSAAAIHNVLVKPTLANKYRITNVETVLRVLRTGGSPDHDIKVEVGDGAASESFTDLVADVDIDGDTVNLPTQRIVVNAVTTVWSTGRTLRCQMGVSGTTTTGTAEIDFILTMVPTNEAIA
jgi:hypothetical protein